jgi:hypothetical protein
MRLDENIKFFIRAILLSFLVLVTIYIYFIDSIAGQRIFGLLLSSTIIAFSMLIYISADIGQKQISKFWLVAGYFTLFLFLSLAIAVS